jgi:hypothetical protein
MTEKKPQIRRKPDQADKSASEPPERPKDELPVSDGDAIAELGDATGGPA